MQDKKTDPLSIRPVNKINLDFLVKQLYIADTEYNCFDNGKEARYTESVQ